MASLFLDSVSKCINQVSVFFSSEFLSRKSSKLVPSLFIHEFKKEVSNSNVGVLNLFIENLFILWRDIRATNTIKIPDMHDAIISKENSICICDKVITS